MMLLRIVSLFLLAPFFSSAQQLHIENYTPANGLLDTRVIKIFQDNRGLIYFLTWEGISIFDGQRFENISEYNGETLGLVNDMIQWKKDTCYVFTFQKGIYKLVNNRLIKDNRFDKVLEPNQVLKINESEYIITSNIGLFKWDGNTVKPLQIQPGGNSGNGVDFAAFSNNTLIYSNNNGKELKAINLANNIIIDSLAGQNISNIRQDSRSDIFVQSEMGWLQLDIAALKSGKLKTKPLYFAPLLPTGFIISKMNFTGNKIWLEDIHKGYILLNPETGEKEFYTGNSVPENNASVIFNDKENNVWFAIFSKLVQKAFPTKLKKVYSNSISAADGLLNDEKNNVIVQSGQHIYLLKDNSPVMKQGMPGRNPFYWQDRSWVFTTTSIIQSNKSDFIDLRKTENADTSFNNSARISFDKEGRLLICGNSFYIIEKNLSVYKIKLPYFTDNIVIDDDNNYWAFARNGTVASYILADGAIQQKGIPMQISNIAPRFAIHWNADTFCVATRYQGIVWLKINNGKVVQTARLNKTKGLSNNFASGLLRKSNNLVYAGTEFGMDEITFSNTDTTVQNLSAAINVFLPFTYIVKSNKDDIFARSNDNQLWYVAENEHTSTGFIPAVWFKEISVNGELIDEGKNKFSYNENNFRITVSAPCFTNASGLRFQFFLENENNNWQQQSSENHYSINNLSPGKYILTATISYPGKIYPDKKIIYSFTINSPVWKQWWFIVIAIGTAAFILWMITRAYFLRKLALQKAEGEKKQAIEKERNRISRDMHDDLGSGLTKIAILSEVAKKQLPEPDKAKEQLEKISESSRELVDNLQDIIWVLNPKNDTLENLSSYIREYALKYFEPLSVKLQFNYPEQFLTGHLSEENRRNVFLTVKESLHNIAKHAWCNEVTISVLEQANSFAIIIEDDGRGFDPEKVRLFANGLKNMQNRIEQVGGSYRINSETGKGTITKIIMTV